MGKSSSAPPPPDPKETAAAQTGTNVATAIANAQLGNVNQVTPYGSLTFDQTGTYNFTDPSSGDSYDIPTFTATQQPGPGGQQVIDNNIATQQAISRIGRNQAGMIENTLSSPLNTSGIAERRSIDDIQRGNYQNVGQAAGLASNLNNAGAITQSVAPSGNPLDIAGNAGQVTGQLGDSGAITRSYGTDFSADRQRVEDALMQRLNPSLERDRSALESRLASQGLRIGSEAYSAAMDDFGRRENDARLGAILGAGQEQTRLADLARNRAGFENQAQAQQFNQNLGVGSFANQAQAQRFAQGMGAQDQAFNQNLAAGQFANQAQAQGFDQLQGRNAALTQEFQNDLAAAAANNNVNDRNFNRDLAVYNAGNAERDAELNERATLRNQPLNEISALLSGSQLQTPNFRTINQPQIATTDYAGLVNQNYQNELSAWQQRQNNRNQMLGMLGGLGKAYIGTM